ncbi:MAG: hypothetical protein EPN93_17160 [Spirochaetes bacterium]|nr:MAG: hypothetical protein EPN93_17160 [Spirochaetota bacterium]
METKGIATATFGLTRNHLESVRPPRSLFLKWPFGHPMGEPGNTAQQMTLLYHAPRLVLECGEPGCIVDLELPWRRYRYSEPDFDALK